MSDCKAEKNRRNKTGAGRAGGGEVPWKSKVGSKAGIFGSGLSVPHEVDEKALIVPVFKTHGRP